MTIVKHELRQQKITFLVWTGAIAFLLAACVFLYPEIKEEMGSMQDMFASMGAFSAAFGLDKLNFGTFVGYYAIECGNVLGLGGAFFAALLAIGSLSKEENGNTAEFLLTHPVSRQRVITSKLISLATLITAMNLIIFAVSMLAAIIVGESVPFKEILLIHLAFYIMQLELSGICFAFSAFLSKGGIGIGLGLAATSYILSLISKLTKSMEFLKYITPFGYCDGAYIVNNGHIDGLLLIIALLICTASIFLAYYKYTKKDIK